MTAYHTDVFLLPPTPLGLLPARWSISHHCSTCWARVPTDQLIDHAKTHQHDEQADTRRDDP